MLKSTYEIVTYLVWSPPYCSMFLVPSEVSEYVLCDSVLLTTVHSCVTLCVICMAGQHWVRGQASLS